MFPDEQPTIFTPPPNGSRPAPLGWQAPSVEEMQTMLPQYEILERIGRGGMGVVYKARQKSLNRLVAVKIMALEAGGHEMRFSERFENEAMAMARLGHPHIVNVHDAGVTAEGLLYYVMEHVEGRDLAQVLEERGRLPEAAVRTIAQQVGEALVYAHEHGIVHRDIKPANVLMGANGTVKVADFGLAKILTPGTVTLTHTATSMGSHAFAAPEVFEHGADADHRADVYSFAVMLYQMLTGVIPRGMFKLPSDHVPELDPQWDEVICKALEQDREDRYQSMHEMMAALGFAFAPRREVGAPSRRWLVFAAAAAVLASGVWWITRQRENMTDAEPGGWTDVLAQMDLTQHVRAGLWRRVRDGLENTDARSSGVMELPVTAPGASDLRIKMARLSTSSSRASIGFHLGSRGGQFSLSDYLRPSVGMEYIDGKGLTENGTQAEQFAAYLSIGHTHELLLQIREEGLAASLDGIEVYRWKGDWSRVTQGCSKMPDALKKSNAFFIATGGSGRIRIEQIAFRHVPGEDGRTLPPLPADAARTLPLPEAHVFAANGHRYQYMPGWFTWSEAEANARTMGGHLATITTQEENDWLWLTFSPWVPSQQPKWVRNRGWWLGAKREPNGDWQWITGEPFGFNRQSTEPEEVPRLSCLLQHDNGGGMSLWRQNHDSERCGYVVEWER